MNANKIYIKLVMPYFQHLLILLMTSYSRSIFVFMWGNVMTD